MSITNSNKNNHKLKYYYWYKNFSISIWNC